MVFRIPFAGESDEFSAVSVLSISSGALLPMFTTPEANTLRLLCREFKEAVADYPWEDAKVVIKGSVKSWRACFPRARTANLNQGFRGRRTPILDSDFVHLKGVQFLNLSGCHSITDAAFAHLKGIKCLHMRFCRQEGITDAAFQCMAGTIQVLDMYECNQRSITDAAFVHLKGVQKLCMGCCNQFTDAAFVHLAGIQVLDMHSCPQPTLTGAALGHLKGVKKLAVWGCSPELVEAAMALNLPVD